MVVARASSIKVEIYLDMKGSHLTFLYLLSQKGVFSAPLLTTQTNQTIYIPSLTMKATAKVQSEHTKSLHYMNIRQLFHMLQLYSTSQIPFCQIRLRSIACHFLVNNLHLITYSNCIVQTHLKNFSWNFPRNSPASWLFLRIKFAVSYLGLNPIECYFLVKHLDFIT